MSAAISAGALAAASTSLDQGWKNPPASAKVRAYWWWLNGNVTKRAITRDLEEMKAKGFGGAVLIDAGGADQDGNAQVPHGPTFFTPEWRELYKHALREANRLGLEVSLNIQSGWDLGGPMVKAEDAVKKLVWTESVIQPAAAGTRKLPEPKHKDPYYRDLFVVAYPIKAGAVPHRPIEKLGEKALCKALGVSAPDTSVLLKELPAKPGEEDAKAADLLDLSAKLEPDGTLRWAPAQGEWKVFRFGCTVGDHAKVSTASDGWNGYALDVYDIGAFKRYWDSVVEPLIADAGPLAGTTLKYLHTDSWEIEAVNWTPTLREEFKKRRGYDFLSYLPVLAGSIIESRDASNRFLFDYRRTMGDLAIDHHYKPFAEWAHRHHLLIHPESGGPHSVPIDAQQCLGLDDAPMAEFWARSWTHRVTDEQRFFVKQPASAAHTYGHRFVVAEGFTTIGPHWQETLWDNLKPSFDFACCEGLNRLVWHAFVCSPDKMGIPGQQYFAGTHLNPNVTWWSKSEPFFDYLNRCQFLLQQGVPIADVCYYYGNNVPNFAQLRNSDPAKLGAGYDYDVISEDALLTRLTAKDGCLVFPDGVAYRVLVLPDQLAISLPVMRKLETFARAGVLIVGPKPELATGLNNAAANDAKVKKIADELWNGANGVTRAISNQTGREALLSLGVQPDFEFSPADKQSALHWIHRREGNSEIYFVSNPTEGSEMLNCSFRITGKAPEIWNPVTGEHHFAKAYSDQNGRTAVPLAFTPYGSLFVLFRSPSADHPATRASNSNAFTSVFELTGPWTVKFDPKWGGPASTTFQKLTSWTARPVPGVRFYSGTATYTKTFDLPTALAGKSLTVDLGNVRELADVRLNGKPLGVVWTPPFRVSTGDALKAKGNILEVDVVNFWPNRIIGDQSLPPEQRFTKTNIQKFKKNTPLMESGLLGPVRLLSESPQ